MKKEINNKENFNPTIGNNCYNRDSVDCYFYENPSSKENDVDDFKESLRGTGRFCSKHDMFGNQKEQLYMENNSNCKYCQNDGKQNNLDYDYINPRKLDDNDDLSFRYKNTCENCNEETVESPKNDYEDDKNKRDILFSPDGYYVTLLRINDANKCNEKVEDTDNDKLQTDSDCVCPCDYMTESRRQPYESMEELKLKKIPTADFARPDHTVSDNSQLNKDYNSPIKPGSNEKEFKQRHHHHHVFNASVQDTSNICVSDSVFFSTKKNSPNRKNSIESPNKNDNQSLKHNSSSKKVVFESAERYLNSFKNNKNDESFEQSQSRNKIKSTLPFEKNTNKDHQLIEQFQKEKQSFDTLRNGQQITQKSGNDEKLITKTEDFYIEIRTKGQKNNMNDSINNLSTIGKHKIPVKTSITSDNQDYIMNSNRLDHKENLINRSSSFSPLSERCQHHDKNRRYNSISPNRNNSLQKDSNKKSCERCSNDKHSVLKEKQAYNSRNTYMQNQHQNNNSFLNSNRYINYPQQQTMQNMYGMPMYYYQPQQMYANPMIASYPYGYQNCNMMHMGMNNINQQPKHPDDSFITKSNKYLEIFNLLEDKKRDNYKDIEHNYDTKDLKFDRLKNFLDDVQKSSHRPTVVQKEVIPENSTRRTEAKRPEIKTEELSFNQHYSNKSLNNSFNNGRKSVNYVSHRERPKHENLSRSHSRENNYNKIIDNEIPLSTKHNRDMSGNAAKNLIENQCENPNSPKKQAPDGRGVTFYDKDPGYITEYTDKFTFINKKKHGVRIDIPYKENEPFGNISEFKRTVPKPNRGSPLKNYSGANIGSKTIINMGCDDSYRQKKISPELTFRRNPRDQILYRDDKKNNQYVSKTNLSKSQSKLNSSLVYSKSPKARSNNKM